MAEIYFDVDSALSEVPVNIAPLIDDTDFKSRETAIAYNAAGMDLVWNFVTTAGAYTQTAVTPTSGGDYDWAHVGDGMYSIEIPASGGASINNDTEGFGWFSGIATGVLPWRSPIFGFRAAAINNALIDGGDILDVNLTEIGGDSQSLTDLKDFADAGYDPATNKIEGVKLADTTTTVTNRVTANTDQIEGVDATNQIRDSILDDATRFHGASIADILADTAEMQGKLPTNNIMGSSDKDNHDTDIDSILADTNEMQGKLPTNNIMGSSDKDNHDTDIDTLLTRCTALRLAELDPANLPTDIANVKSDTASILVDTAEMQSKLPAGTISSLTLAQIIAGISDGSLDLQEMLRIIFASVAGKTTNNGLRFRNSSDTKDRIIATVDASKNRTSMTYDGS